MSKKRYTGRHINELVRRLNQYERFFRTKSGKLPACSIACGHYNCGHITSLDADCLIDHCLSGGCTARCDARDGKNTPAAKRWYWTMIARANRRLAASGSPWRIEGDKRWKV